MRIAFVSLSALLLFVSAVAAETPIVDIRGTWIGASEAVTNGKDGAVFSSVTIKAEITEQTGRRFAGIVDVGGRKIPFAGVFRGEFDFIWAEPGGAVDGRLTHPDEMQACYVTFGDESPLAGCEILKRQK